MTNRCPNRANNQQGANLIEEIEEYEIESVNSYVDSVYSIISDDEIEIL